MTGNEFISSGVDRGMALVSIVIVNYNGRDFLRKCLSSVLHQSYRPIEVIVVDNGSTDGSKEAVRNEYPGVTIIANSDNRGFAEANNQGTEKATGETVVLLNNDTEVRDGWIQGLLRLLALPDTGLVTSKVITDGVPPEYYEMNGTINYLGYNIMRHFTDTSKVFFGGGASLAFRKRDVDVPFPSEYFLYHEDVYLSWRMRLRGFQVRMAQDSIVDHRGSASTNRESAPLVTFYQERNRLLNSLLFYSSRTLFFLTPYLLLDAIAKLLLSIVGKRKSFAGIVRGYLWILTHRSWVTAMRRSIQQERVIQDADILLLMSSKVLEGDGFASRAANRLSHLYATVTGFARNA